MNDGERGGGDGFERVGDYLLRLAGPVVEAAIPEHGMGFAFRKIHDGTSGFTAEMETWIAGDYIDRSRINLSAATTRASYAKTLLKLANSHTPEGFDYEVTLSELARHVQDRWRKGQPPTDLMEDLASVRPEPDYFIRPLMFEKETAILFGPPGKGKSFFTTCLALCVAGHMELPYGLRPARRGPVLWLDFEASSDDTHRKRVKRLLAANSHEGGYPVYHWAMRQPLVDAFEEIALFVAQQGIVLLVIDGILWATGKDALKPSEVTPTLEALRLLDIPKWAIGHPPKGNEDTFFGSQAWSALARSMWQFIYDRDSPEDRIFFLLKQTKSNFDKAWQVPLSFCLAFEAGHTVRLESTEVDPDSELGGHIGVPARAVALLKKIGRPMTAPLVANRLGETNPENVRRQLNRLVERGELVRGQNSEGQTVYELNADDTFAPIRSKA